MRSGKFDRVDRTIKFLFTFISGQTATMVFESASKKKSFKSIHFNTRTLINTDFSRRKGRDKICCDGYTENFLRLNSIVRITDRLISEILGLIRTKIVPKRYFDNFKSKKEESL